MTLLKPKWKRQTVQQRARRAAGVAMQQNSTPTKK
jgi:hypothetical protein